MYPKDIDTLAHCSTDMKSPSLPSAFTGTVCVLSIIALMVSSRKVDDVRAESGETERIVGGVNANPSQFPWMVALHYRGGFICGASILNSRTLLTAAHCVMNNGSVQPADLFYGIANVNRRSSVVRIDFEALWIHDGFENGSAHDDIAVLLTLEPIVFPGDRREEVGPVCIAGPERPELQCSWKNATAMGWGNTERKDVVYPDTLQYTEVKIVKNRECGLLNSGIDENKICAKGNLVNGLAGICAGDSGGPLVRFSRDEAPVQMGVAAYINPKFGCGSIAAGVFTRVSSYHDFIKSHAVGSLCVVRSCSRIPF